MRSLCVRSRLVWLVSIVLPLIGVDALAQPALELITVSEGGEGTATWSVSLQVLLFMSLLSVLPALLMTMTSFTRIIIVLAILRQGLGTQQTPSNTILIGISLILTGFIMAPVFQEVNASAVQPYIEQEIGPMEALEAGKQPLRDFMLHHTREGDIELFATLANIEDFESVDDIPFTLLLPAYVTSELKTAFIIGFCLLIPFLVIDLVVASVLMSVGMVMLSPLIISLPFKIMLFILIDGWSLIMAVIAATF